MLQVEYIVESTAPRRTRAPMTNAIVRCASTWSGPFFTVGRRPALRFELLEQLDGREVVQVLALQRTSAKAVRLGDPVVALVALRFRFGIRWPEGDPFFIVGYSLSGWRKM
jgi:hypothetical protein